MPISEKHLRQVLQNTFPNAKIELTDTRGDQDHYALEISDNIFKGLPLIKQHKLVNDALEEVLAQKLHAISIKIKMED